MLHAALHVHEVHLTCSRASREDEKDARCSLRNCSQAGQLRLTVERVAIDSQLECLVTKDSEELVADFCVLVA